MKHLLAGVAVVATLALAGPVWAQAVSPSGGNAMGTPGPNPGGPGLTPYSGGAATPPSSSYESSATPPTYSHHHAYYHHHKMANYHREMANYHKGKAYPLTGTNADQLNREEVARLQGGNYSNPPAPSYPPSEPPPPMGTTGGGAYKP